MATNKTEKTTATAILQKIESLDPGPRSWAYDQLLETLDLHMDEYPPSRNRVLVHLAGYLNNEMVGNRYNPAFGEWVDSL